MLHAADLASLEQAEANNSLLLAANGVFNQLASLQSQLQNSSASCEGWAAYSVGLSRVFATSVVRQGVVYTSNLSIRYTSVGPAEDNLTLLRPFNGYENGSLNLVVQVSMHASAGPGFPQYGRDETHFVHLPLRIDRALSMCGSALRDIRGISSGMCSNATLRLLESRYEGLANSHGLRLSIERVSGQGDACLGTKYQVIVQQDSVEGVAGNFVWRMVGLAEPSR